MLRRRAAPVAADAQRFPHTEQQLERGCKFASAHLQWLDAHGHSRWCPGIWGGQVRLDNTDWRAQAGWAFDCWWALLQVRQGNCVESNLIELRRLLGPEAFALGIMPDCVPWRMFRELGKGEEP